jgi:hypothetical protein
MVVLDEDAIGEIKPMVMSSATTHGIFVEKTQAGNGLPRIKDASLGSSNHIHVPPSCRSNATHALKKIQNHAFAGEDHAGVVSNNRNRLPIVQPHSIEYLRVADDFMMSDSRLVQIAVNLENAVDRAQPGKNARLLSMYRGRGTHPRIDARLSGGVASGTIFEEGSFENFSDAPAVPIQCANSVERVGEMQRRSKFTVRPRDI